MVKTNQECCAHVVDNSTNTLGAEGESPTPLTSLRYPQMKAPWKRLPKKNKFQKQLINSARVEGRTLCPPKVVAPRSSAQVSYLDGTANLDGFEPLYLYKERTKKCTPRYIVQECECGRNILPSTCMSTKCVNCEPFTNSRRAFSIFNRFVPFENPNVKPVIYTVFTVPKHARDRFTNPKAWQKVRIKVWRILKKNFGGLYGVECSHPTGDLTEEFHPHLNFLWRVRKGYRPYIDVDALRDEWKKILGVRSVDLKSNYYDHPGMIMQKCQYASRVFPGYHYWTGSIRWYGKYPRKGKPENNVCQVCEQRFNIIGFISKIDVDDWYKYGWTSGREPPWYDDKKITRFKQKSKCNASATPC